MSCGDNACYSPIFIVLLFSYMDDSTDDMPGHVATGREETRQGRDTSRFTLTVDQVAEQFATAGLPITQRTVQRYCSSGKIDCIRIDPDTRLPTEKNAYTFLIDPASLSKRMEELRERREFVTPTGDASPGDTSRHDAPGRDETRHDEPENPSRIEELEEENLQLKIDKAGKEQFIKHLVNERKQTVGQLTEQGRQIGILQTRLQQIEAPKEPVRDAEPAQTEGEGDNLFSENQDDSVQ